MRRDAIEELALQHGQSNLRFFVPLRPLRRMACGFFTITSTSSSDEHVVQECVVDDEGRYPRIVHEDGHSYKVSLKPLDPSYESRDYYVSDLASILTGDPDPQVGIRFLNTDTH